MFQIEEKCGVGSDKMFKDGMEIVQASGGICFSLPEKKKKGLNIRKKFVPQQ